jgi:hypothetical protein
MDDASGIAYEKVPPAPTLVAMVAVVVLIITEKGKNA